MSHLKRIKRAFETAALEELNVDQRLYKLFMKFAPTKANFWKIIDICAFSKDQTESQYKTVMDTIHFVYGSRGMRDLHVWVQHFSASVEDRVNAIYRSNEEDDSVILPYGDDFHSDFYTQVVALGEKNYRTFMKAPKAYLKANRDKPFINLSYAFGEY